MGKFRHRETSQIAHHHQNVFVHGVDVEQIVLHLPNHAAESRDIAAKNAIAVHASQNPGLATGFTHDLQEQQLIDRVAAKLRVDARAGIPQRP